MIFAVRLLCEQMHDSSKSLQAFQHKHAWRENDPSLLAARDMGLPMFCFETALKVCQAFSAGVCTLALVRLLHGQYGKLGSLQSRRLVPPDCGLQAFYWSRLAYRYSEPQLAADGQYKLEHAQQLYQLKGHQLIWEKTSDIKVSHPWLPCAGTVHRAVVHSTLLVLCLAGPDWLVSPL